MTNTHANATKKDEVEELETKTISIRLNKKMIDELKKQALEIDVPYQCLMKIFIAEKLKEKS